QGADTERRQGPARAVQSGWISPSAMLRATWLMFALAAMIGVYLSYRAGWPMAVLAGLSILCGIWYTAGTNSLAYLGVADLCVLAFFGPIAVGGTYFAQTPRLPWHVPFAGLAPGLLATGLLVVNNLRDIDVDRSAGKRTLAVRFGPSFSRWQYTYLILLAAGVPWVLWRFAHYPLAILASMVIVIPGLWVICDVWRREGSALNRCLGATAGLLALFAITFCCGCLFG
ncbi:MAG TPA: 1,4-dihydroxy-2-naphthoate octaprenyltransferase, partial [Pirellulaceae bacterium]